MKIAANLALTLALAAPLYGVSIVELRMESWGIQFSDDGWLGVPIGEDPELSIIARFDRDAAPLEQGPDHAVYGALRALGRVNDFIRDLIDPRLTVRREVVSAHEPDGPDLVVVSYGFLGLSVEGHRFLFGTTLFDEPSENPSVAFPTSFSRTDGTKWDIDVWEASPGRRRYFTDGTYPPTVVPIQGEAVPESAPMLQLMSLMLLGLAGSAACMRRKSLEPRR